MLLKYSSWEYLFEIQNSSPLTSFQHTNSIQDKALKLLYRSKRKEKKEQAKKRKENTLLSCITPLHLPSTSIRSLLSRVVAWFTDILLTYQLHRILETVVCGISQRSAKTF
jgi:hypothetical protein